MGSLAARTNDLLYATTPANRYATAFLCSYDPATGECKWVNCAHCDGLILRANGEVSRLGCTGLALGMFPGQTYEEETSTLNVGDVLAVYSDGVCDAQDLCEEDFGVERLIGVLRECAAEPPEAIVDAVFTAIDSFAGDAPQFDDITILVVKRVGGLAK